MIATKLAPRTIRIVTRAGKNILLQQLSLRRQIPCLGQNVHVKIVGRKKLIAVFFRFHTAGRNISWPICQTKFSQKVNHCICSEHVTKMYSYDQNIILVLIITAISKQICVTSIDDHLNRNSHACKLIGCAL